MTNAEVKKFLAAYSPAVRALAEATRAMILATRTDLTEKVYPGWKVIGYGPGTSMKEMVFGISPARDYVALQFNRGAELPDPEGLLQGASKTARRLKIQDAAMLKSPAVRAMIEAAWRLYDSVPLPPKADKTAHPNLYQVGASKVVAAPLAELYRAWHDARTRRQWLGAEKLEVRGGTAGKSMRITWADGSDVQVLFYAKGANKSSVAVDHRKLTKSSDIEKLRAFWKDRLAALKALLED